MTELAPLDDHVKAQLATVCAATIATELFNRGLRNCFLYGLKPLNPAHCRFVGEAFTLRFIPSREDIDNYHCPSASAIASFHVGTTLGTRTSSLCTALTFCS